MWLKCLNLMRAVLPWVSPADIVLWSADPFELSSSAEKMWIGGEEQELESRQDKLRDRYMATSDMPRAYTK